MGGIVENDKGFITYVVFEDTKECMIQDLYIRPQHRCLGTSREFEAEVIKAVKDKCNKLTATVDLFADSPERNTRLMIKAGFKLYSANNNVISFIKEI